MLQDLFADPALAGDKRYADVLREYLRSETIAPLPLQRLAAAHPDTVDAVFRKILRKRDFTWAEHGEALMRRRKAWYYRREPRPGVSVIGARLMELARGETAGAARRTRLGVVGNRDRGTQLAGISRRAPAMPPGVAALPGDCRGW